MAHMFLCTGRRHFDLSRVDLAEKKWRMHPTLRHQTWMGNLWKSQRNAINGHLTAKILSVWWYTYPSEKY